MRPVILLTGKNGQVGSELLRLLPQLGEVVALGRGELDLSNPTGISRTIREVRPWIIVNAAAYTAVDQSETDEATAQAVNAECPRLMAEEAKRIGAALVHYSTDYIFDGTKRVPYDEADPANPINVYGRTKLAGEQAIRASGVSHLIFRTSWVYSTRGRNFLLTILRLATEREELRIVCDQIGPPTCAWNIAEATNRVLIRIFRDDTEQYPFSSWSGTYHMTAAGETSWYGFARTILEAAPRISPNVSWFAATTQGRPLITKRITPISTEEFPSPARRPAYSVLSNSRLSQIFHLALPDWETQLQRCLSTTQIDDPQEGSFSRPGVGSSTSAS